MTIISEITGWRLASVDVTALPGDGDRAVTRAPVTARAPLFERLSAAAECGLTLVSAPAGSGKTMLLRSWIDNADLGDHTGWVSVEPDERDGQRFWRSVIDELHRAAGGAGVVDRFTPTPAFDGEAVVDRMLTALSSLQRPVNLVIDDLHELRCGESLAQLRMLISRRPSLLRLILVSRHDPQLGLHRPRLTGELTELRAADLAFSLADARSLLAASGIALSDECLAVLHARTEGWAAGLRLAAISLAGHPEPERFIAEFSGSERTVAEYLLAEVLERQPDEVRRLLLYTSVLHRVSGALADHLLGGQGSERVLHALEQANAFVVALDAGRSWFRYHQLFADLLRLELRRTHPEVVSQLHDAAAGWYAEHGYVVDAVQHAQIAQNWQYAARLLGEHELSLVLDGRMATVDALLSTFPPHAAADPQLAPAFVSQQLRRRSVEEAAASLDLGERGILDVPTERRRSVEVRLAVMRLWLAGRMGDFDSVVDQVGSLLASVGTETPGEIGLGDDVRAVALVQLGTVETWAHRMADAEIHLQQALQLARRAQRPYLEAQCLARLPGPALHRSLSLVRERAATAIAVADEHGWGAELFVVFALGSAAAADVWQGDFATAEARLTRAEQTSDLDLDPALALPEHVVRAMLHDGQGRYEQALAAARDAERFRTRVVAPGPFSAFLHGLMARMQVQLGDTAAARASLDALSEPERETADGRVARAAVEIADGNAHAAIEVLAPVLAGSAEAFHLTSLVTAVLFEARAHDMLGDVDHVDSAIERALVLAGPDGLVWPFVITHSHNLLERRARQGTAHAGLISRIRDVVSGPTPQEREVDPLPLPANLTQGELRVLRYLASTLSATEIAAELYLSVNTVRTHMRHIYEKLGVRRRTDAIERASELGLLAAPSMRRRRSDSPSADPAGA
jgi:LuxR family transcriptional regulator, maltose regulon positive regulatory protein